MIDIVGAGGSQRALINAPYAANPVAKIGSVQASRSAVGCGRAVVAVAEVIEALIVYAAADQEPGTGGFIAILVIGILLGTVAVVILGNLGGYRDSHARRIINQRALFGLDKVFGRPSLRYITALQIVGGVLFLSFALFMIFSAIANLS